MKEKYIKPTCEIISLPEEEFFTTSNNFGSYAVDDDNRVILFGGRRNIGFQGNFFDSGSDETNIFE